MEMIKGVGGSLSYLNYSISSLKKEPMVHSLICVILSQGKCMAAYQFG